MANTDISASSRPFSDDAVGALIDRIDWSGSRLGPMEHWSELLTSTLRLILPARAQIVLFWGPDHVALYNDSYVSALGAKHPRALGRPAAEGWSELWDDLAPLLRAVCEQGKTVEARDRPFRIARHGDPELAYFDISYSPVREADGSIAAVIGIVAETTERVRESEALAVLNALAQRIAAELDQAKLVQTVVDAGLELTGGAFGAFLSDDDTLQALAGAERSALAGFRKARLFAPAALGSDPVRSDDIALDPRFDGEVVHRGAPAGNPPLRSYLAVPVTLRSGEKAGGLFFGHPDIGTFDARAEELAASVAAHAAVGIDNARLFEASRRLNANLEEQVARRTAERDRIWQASRDMLGVADGDGVWQSVNPAWTSVLGWNSSDILGRTTDWLMHPEDFAATRAEIVKLGEGIPTLAFENRFRARDGSYRAISWTAVPLDGLLYAVGRDVTEERARERTLAETEEQLRQAQKMEVVGHLTGGIAHDFNNLLQIVTGNLETVMRLLPEDTGRVRRAAGNAMTGAQRAAALTQRLLAFSRRQPLAPKPLRANALVATMIDLLHRTLGETIAVRTMHADDLWHVEADANQLESAILNLAINARDAMPQGGALTIETRNVQLDATVEGEAIDGDFVLIDITDTGTGMDAATLARVFEPFFTTKDVGKGTGLGLSMIYGFVKQSGGHVRLRSRPGEGTSVCIYLPRFLADADLAPEPEAAPSDMAHGAREGETILVCEDDDDVRAHSTEILDELGYRVLEARDGPAAVRLLGRRGERIDLLFTDVVLPGGMTGAMVAQQARALRPGLRILFTTGYARDTIVHHGRLDPGVALITKPFAYDDLARRIRAMIDGG